MIHIEKDQNILEEKNLRVSSATGDYNDTDLIDFYDVTNPDVVAGSFQAQYIKYGGFIYKFNDPKELGEEILKIDPESTHSAASFVRMSNELLSQMNGGNLSNSSVETIMEEEGIQQEKKIKIEESIKEKADEGAEELDFVPAIVPNPDSATSTTTPSISIDDSRIEVKKVIDEATDVVKSVNRKVEEISKTAETISDVVEKIVK